ncbi:MAG: nicotinate-nucleotide diphosphorylase (carboxylating) [Spirochaetes bacterium RBG_13_68_11]|nr:MAG: nicotinate-nucleotide diphosphorylase (carboxylating) [Spirochaetes bacterium RBG_13_68_11]
MQESDYRPLIELAIAEDLGNEGDVTSLAVIPEGERRAVLWSKDHGVLAGEEVFAAVFRRIDPSVAVTFLLHDGARLAKSDRVAEVRGRALSLLSGERIALNFICHLSGIASEARALSDLAASTGKAVILDTRKTLPGWRALAKYAAGVGGARNHRMGLYDMVLVKDNHVDAAGSVAAAVARVRARWGTRFPVEVEARTLAEVREAVDAGADTVMLDNMDEPLMREAVALVADRARTEASGNMTRERIPGVSATGVDFISVGSLTHSVKAFDFSLKIGC